MCSCRRTILSYSLLILCLVLAGCGGGGSTVGSPPPQGPQPVTETDVTTGADGSASFPAAGLQVQVGDLVSLQALAGIDVTLFAQGTQLGLAVVDPSGQYGPEIFVVGNQSVTPNTARNGVKTNAQNNSTTAIAVSLTSLQFLTNAGSTTPVSLTVGMLNYSLPKYYSCTTESFGQVKQNLPTLILGAGLKQGAKYGLIKLFGTLGTDAAAIVKGTFTVLGIPALGAFDVSLLQLDTYVALGYADTDMFKVCSPQGGLASFVFGQAFLLQPQAQPSGQPVFGTAVSGTVFDASSNQPINGALVTLSGPSPASQVTGSNGSFLFSSPIAFLSGSYAISVSQFGYVPSSSQFMLGPGQSYSQNVYLAKPSPASCVPAGAVGVLVHGQAVDAYVPNGSYLELATGVDFVPVEDTIAVGTRINTPNPVNSCSSNPSTGETICTANNTDVYALAGSNLLNTFTSAGSGFLQTSGGSCTNCGVVVDPTTNTAVIGISLASGSGYQLFDMGSHSLSSPIPAPYPGFSSGPNISESFSIGIVTKGRVTQRFLLSPSEDFGTTADYELFDISFPASPNAYSFAGLSSVLSPHAEYDSAAADCSTGIALATQEGTSNVFIADLTQATFNSATASGPPSWNAPSQLQSLPEFSGFGAGTTGITIAPGSHLGLLEDEFGTTAFGAIQLPSTSGTGTPSVVDWVVASMPNDPSGFPWSMPLDPHGLSAYTSPNTGRAMALLMNRQRTYLAVIDLQALLSATRSVPHVIDVSVDLVGTGIVRFVPIP